MMKGKARRREERKRKRETGKGEWRRKGGKEGERGSERKGR